MGKDWDTKLCKCQCRDLCPLCWSDNECLVRIAPPIAFANIAEKAGVMSWVGAFVSMEIPGWNFRLLGKTRETIRKQHDIDGTRCKDDCVVCCCLPCALEQMQNQIDPSGNKMGESIERI